MTTSTAGMKPADFFCVRTSGLPAAFIRRFTRSKFNHVVLIEDDEWGWEAAPSGWVVKVVDWLTRTKQSQHGFRRVPLANYDGFEMVRSTGHYTLTDQQRLDVVRWCYAHDGVPYGWGDIVAMGLDSRGIRFGWVDDRLHSPTTLFCSQAAAASYAHAGVAVVPGKKPWRVTPGDEADEILGLPIPEDV